MANSKGMTLNKFEVTCVEMKAGGKESKVFTLSAYKEPEMVVKSVQSDMMKQKLVAVSAKLVESRKVQIDLDAAWKAAEPKPKA